MLTQLSTQQMIKRVAEEGLSLPQLSAPVYHFFGPGIYIREMHAKKGTLLVGRDHKTDHLCYMTKGKVLIVGDNGLMQVIRAPYRTVSKTGSKMAIVTEDVVWQNIYATEERDIEVLEDIFMDCPDNLISHRDSVYSFDASSDRADFESSCRYLNSSERHISDISKIHFDGVKQPYLDITPRQSFIHGLGLFCGAGRNCGDEIIPVRVDGSHSIAIPFINHSVNPNSEYHIGKDGRAAIKATRDIRGCSGGDHGEEITMNYRQVPLYRGAKWQD